MPDDLVWWLNDAANSILRPMGNARHAEKAKEAVAELTRLKAENERLRGVLESIVDYWNGSPESAVNAIEEVEFRASSALNWGASAGDVGSLYVEPEAPDA